MRPQLMTCAGDAIQIRANGRGKAGVEGFGDQRMANRDFFHIGHGAEEIGQIVLREIMAGIDFKPGGLGAAGGLGTGDECAAVTTCMAAGKRAGVKLDTFGAAFVGTGNRGVFGIGK